MNERKEKTNGIESFFLWNNWETPKPSNTFFTRWPDAINSYRSGQVWPTWAPPPPPLNPAPPTRQVLSTGGRRKQLTDPTTSDRSVRTDDRRPLDEQEKLVPVYTSSSAPAPHMMPFVLSYYIESLLPFGRSSTIRATIRLCYYYISTTHSFYPLVLCNSALHSVVWIRIFRIIPTCKNL